jgi:hypothetical protein
MGRSFRPPVHVRRPCMLDRPCMANFGETTY